MCNDKSACHLAFAARAPVLVPPYLEALAVPVSDERAHVRKLLRVDHRCAVGAVLGAVDTFTTPFPAFVNPC